MRYRAKRVEVEAWHFNGAHGMGDVPEWMGDVSDESNHVVVSASGEAIYVRSQRHDLGTWIIRYSGERMGFITTMDALTFATVFDAVSVDQADNGSGHAEDPYADHRFIAVRQDDAGEYAISSTLNRENAAARAKRDVEEWGARKSTVCEVVTTFERRHVSVEVAPRHGFGGSLGDWSEG